ncbi:N-acetylglucosamine kinase [Kitasatospora sp. NPDC058965]|uniref:N-acetylglucosamine kinase n=1 Tax=Kitasatospora sp. NPDC058965 TaxID=3346682 RepID=UPI00369D0A09
MSGLSLGLDVGGTRTRAVLLDAAGAVHGRGEAGGGNPAGHGAQAALVQLSAAVRDALGATGRERVTDCLVGLAGYRALPDPQEFADRCRAAFGLRCPVRLVPDAVPALAAGGVEHGTGTVLIAGTGSVCVGLTDHHVRGQEGGLGWLLGDEGSGFWLGRAALQHALRAPQDPLGAAVLAHCRATTPTELVCWAYADSPRRLAALAPLVTRAADRGEAAALALTHRAAADLAALARTAARPGEPLVLAGSVATAPGPLRTELLTLLADFAPRLPVTDAATAAARLARLARSS